MYLSISQAGRRQFLQNSEMPDTEGAEFQLAYRLIFMTEDDLQPLKRELGFEPLGPFHQTETVSVKIVDKAEILQISVSGQAVQIEVVQRNAALMDIEEGERGARHRGCRIDPHSASHAAGKAGF